MQKLNRSIALGLNWDGIADVINLRVANKN